MEAVGVMAEAPGPLPSRRPEYAPELPDEPKTDPGSMVDADYVKRKLEQQGHKLTLRSMAAAIAAVATTVVAGLIFIDNRVAAQTDAGVRVLDAQQKGIDARVTTMEKRLDRVDDKLDLLLDAARVPKWKRPVPLTADGGVP